MTRSALIGHTGFVGGNLLRQRPFDDLFRSTDIHEIAGREYDLLVCAGAPAEKWKANKDPAGDRAALARLTEPLRTVRARKAILVSTIDVYPHPLGVDEDTAIVPDPDNAYGAHRLDLERFFQERFDTLIVRLPALFGDGLKKNAVYDLLNGNMVEAIHSEATFQFYGLGTLWTDLARFLAAGVQVVNVATEPLTVGEVAREALGITFTNDNGRPPARYDFRTKHDRLLGGSGGYLQRRNEVLAAMKAWADAYPRRAR
jgi:nucleoside-diphosphate-sugar epimerase